MPGPDGIHGFWWKVLPGARSLLKDLIGKVINETMPVPQWLVTGRTVLIPKCKPAGRPDQYRPIACLNTSYKIFTATVERILRRHVVNNNILLQEQCALKKGRRGCFDALMVDAMVCEDATFRGRNLSVAWIDYQKAFDHVPHE